MTKTVSKTILVGRLGRDPEIRTTQAGKQITNLSVATSEGWKDKNTGEWQDRTEWHKVVSFVDHHAKFAGSLRKGDLVYVEGQNETRKWTDQNGQDKYTTEIVLRPYKGELTSLSPKSEDTGQTPAGVPDNADDLDDGSIPF